MGYEDFVHFMLSEEDKSSEPSLEFWYVFSYFLSILRWRHWSPSCLPLWFSCRPYAIRWSQDMGTFSFCRFKCIDLDENGVITPNEMQFFYEEQLHRMECVSQEPVLFEDILCQIVDMIAPEVWFGVYLLWLDYFIRYLKSSIVLFMLWLYTIVGVFHAEARLHYTTGLEALQTFREYPEYTFQSKQVYCFWVPWSISDSPGKYTAYSCDLLFNWISAKISLLDWCLGGQERENPSLTEWDRFAHREYIRLAMEEDGDNASNGSADVWDESFEAPFWEDSLQYDEVGWCWTYRLVLLYFFFPPFLFLSLFAYNYLESKRAPKTIEEQKVLDSKNCVDVDPAYSWGIHCYLCPWKFLAVKKNKITCVLVSC